MNAPVDRRVLDLDKVAEEIARAPVPDNRRLALAGRIAGGLCGNPNACVGYDWQGDVARSAWSIAGKLMLLSESGGC
jgi:hypothetical protein